MKYSPALDGLRGIAILAVCCCHWHVPYIHGGFYGVDIFFVLSGYLISSILLSEMQKTGGVNFSNFYKRRILRLFPALCFLLIIYGVMSIFDADPMHYYTDILLVFFYLSNWSKAVGSKHPVELGHTWSLSVEEQFYLIWPPLLLLIVNRFKPKYILAITLLLAIFFTIERYVLSFTSPWYRLYHSLDTRIDVLLYGCVLALIVHFWKDKVLHFMEHRVFSIIGCAGLALSLAYGNDSNFLTYKYGLFGVAMSTLPVVACTISPKNGIVKRVLSWNFLVWFGKRSYGLYLWHLPIIIYLKPLDGRLGFPLASVVLTLVATEISYRLVERPFLALKDRVAVKSAVVSSPEASKCQTA